MISTNNQITVLAIVGLSIALMSSIGAVQAELNQKMPYGSIAQEDELFTYVNGTLYLNVVFEKGNGQFMTIPAIVDETEKLLNEGLVQ